MSFVDYQHTVAQIIYMMQGIVGAYHNRRIKGFFLLRKIYPSVQSYAALTVSPFQLLSQKHCWHRNDHLGAGLSGVVQKEGGLSGSRGGLDSYPLVAIQQLGERLLELTEKNAGSETIFVEDRSERDQLAAQSAAYGC